MTISPEAQQAPAVLSLEQQLFCLFESLAVAQEMLTDPDAWIAGL